MRIRETILTLLLYLPTLTFAQIDNRWQPDSVYANHKVKKILVYLNSPKDLSEVVDFDESGKRIRSIKYSASYNKRSRKRKAVQHIKLYNYDSLNRLVSIIDSTGSDSTLFFYDTDGELTSSRKRLSNLVYRTTFSHSPFKSVTTVVRDTIVVYEKTKEYERGFYVKSDYGYYYEPKLKKDTSIINGQLNITSYSDRTDLQRFEDNKTVVNTFNEDGHLIKSEIRSVFMNDRVSEYELHYKYFTNGLLNSVRGYVPRYFEYEYWE